MTGPAAGEDRVRLTVDGHVARIVLDVPDRRNAFDGDVAAAVLRCLDVVAADDDIRVLVLSGAGGTFSAGGDLRAMAGLLPAGVDEAEVRRRRDDTRALLRIAEVLRALPAVSIAAVTGVCAGGAMGWACACDLRVAASSARFVPAFGAAAQTGDYGITWTLPRIVGAGRARDLLLVGDHLGAAEAERIGLVTRVYDDDRFEAEVAALADRVAGYAPLALRAIKANLDGAMASTLDAALDAEAMALAQNSNTADAAEAMAAFTEKRPPMFTGR